MRRIKKNIKIFIILILGMLIFIILHRLLKQKHLKEYKLENKYKILEKYTIDNKKDNYYFEIEVENNKFYFQINKNFKKKAKIIKKIYYYNDDDYKCILPVFKRDLVLTDIMCLKDNLITNYRDLNDEKMDEFASSIKQYKKEKNNNIESYNNIIKNHYIGLSNYKGLYILNKEMKEEKLFENDKYKRDVSTFIKNYYLTADYNQNYNFNKIYLVNLLNNKVKEIIFNYDISFDSFIQGIVKDKVYIFDKSNKKQYEFNINNLKMKQIGDIKSGIKYFDNGFKRITPSEAMNKYFKNYIMTSSDDYNRIDIVGNKTGYKYYYKKNNNKYLVYRSNMQNDNQLTYLFTTNEIDRIKYYDDFVYYIKDDVLMFYNDQYGNREVIRQKELKFNKNLTYGVYIK